MYENEIVSTAGRFRKSRACEGGGACVEWARVGETVLLRNSRYPEGPVMSCTSAEWAAFLTGAKAGEFD